MHSWTSLLSFAISMVTLFHVTETAKFIVIFDEVFEKQISHQTWTRNITFTSIKKNQRSIFEFTNFSFNENDNSTVYFLFTQNGHFYEKMLFLIPDERKINFAESPEALERILGNTLYSYCLDYSAALRRTIVALVFSLFLQDVAIVTDKSYCSLKFYKSLENALTSHPINKQIHLKLHHVIYDPKEPISRRNDFYRLKIMEISLLILLTPSRYSNELFKSAEHFGLLSPSHLWLMPSILNQVEENLNVFLSTSRIPSKIMTVEFTQTATNKQNYPTTYSTLSESIMGLTSFYDGALDEECKNYSRRQDVEFCIKSTLYTNLLQNERHYDTGNLRLVVSIRDLTDADQTWVTSSAEIVGDQFFLRDDNIRLLGNTNEERGNKKNNKIVAVTLEDEPYSVVMDDRYDNRTHSCTTGIICRKPIKQAVRSTYKITCCSGYVIEFFEFLVKDLNLEVDMYLVEDNKYGVYRDGHWDGLIGDVTYGKADIAVGGISITGERSKAVDFTSPWVEVDMGILVKPKNAILNFINFEFIAPLKIDLQIALWITVLGFVVLTFILENSVFFISLTRERYLTEKFFSLYESITYMGGVTFQRDLGGIHPVRPGARVAAVVFAFGMMVIVTTYTALLVQQGVNREEKEPFLGSKDTRMRNPTTKYTFATSKSTSYEAFFSNSESDVFRRISMFMSAYNVESTEEAVNNVKQGSINAYLYDYDFLVWYVSRDKNCELKVLKDPLIPSGLGFATTKNSRWLSNLNHAILRQRGSDKIQILHQKWFFNGGCNLDELEAIKVRLSIDNFGGYIIVLIGTIAGCFFMLIPERIYFKYFRNKISKALRKFFMWCEHGTVKRHRKKYELNPEE